MNLFWMIELGSMYTPKNKLQAKVQEVMETYDHKIISLDNLIQTKEEIIMNMNILNDEFPRCKSIKFEWWSPSLEEDDIKKDYILSTDDQSICQMVLRWGYLP